MKRPGPVVFLTSMSPNPALLPRVGVLQMRVVLLCMLLCMLALGVAGDECACYCCSSAPCYAGPGTLAGYAASPDDPCQVGACSAACRIYYTQPNVCPATTELCEFKPGAAGALVLGLAWWIFMMILMAPCITVCCLVYCCCCRNKTVIVQQSAAVSYAGGDVPYTRLNQPSARNDSDLQKALAASVDPNQQVVRVPVTNTGGSGRGSGSGLYPQLPRQG